MLMKMDISSNWIGKMKNTLASLLLDIRLSEAKKNKNYRINTGTGAVYSMKSGRKIFQSLVVDNAISSNAPLTPVQYVLKRNKLSKDVI